MGLLSWPSPAGLPSLWLRYSPCFSISLKVLASRLTTISYGV